MYSVRVLWEIQMYGLRVFGCKANNNYRGRSCFVLCRTTMLCYARCCACEGFSLIRIFRSACACTYTYGFYVCARARTRLCELLLDTVLCLCGCGTMRRARGLRDVNGDWVATTLARCSSLHAALPCVSITSEYVCFFSSQYPPVCVCVL